MTGEEACTIMADLYEQYNLLVNFFFPSMKIISKHRLDAKLQEFFTLNLQNPSANYLRNLLKASMYKNCFLFTPPERSIPVLKKHYAKTEQSEKNCMGIFGCKGFDTFGPLKLISGLNKGRPNENDFKNAIDFLKRIL